MIEGCTCGRPPSEDGVMCDVCERAWIDGLLAIDADKIPAREAWEEYARRQG